MIRAGGLDVHVEEVAPTGPPRGTVVLVHGLAADSMASWFLTLVHPLAAAGYRVLLHDLRGHGHTSRPATGYSLDHFVGDLEAVLGHWDVDGPFHLLGNSFGGTIAYAYAARHPARVLGIVAIESSPPTAAWFTAMGRRLAFARENTGPSRRAKATAALLATTTLGTDLPASRLPDPAAIAALTCPVLCLFGTGSPLYKLAGETTRLLDHAERIDFAGQRHTLLIDHPAPVRDSVLRWLTLRETRHAPIDHHQQRA